MDSVNKNIKSNQLICELKENDFACLSESIDVYDKNNNCIGTVSYSDINEVSMINLDKLPISTITRYNFFYKYLYEHPSSVAIQNLFELLLSKNQLSFIKILSEFAGKHNVGVFMVGGGVRDLLLGKLCLDLDIAIESNAVEFANEICLQNPNIIISGISREFYTAKVLYICDDETLEIDIASTRTESYPIPGQLPVISSYGCSIKEDLLRRDFTINAMAIDLRKDSFCELIDYFNGYNHLKMDLLDVIHPLSLIEDPTRIIRGVEFAIRFNFNFSKPTEYLAKSLFQEDIYNNYKSKRFKLELIDLLNLNTTDFVSFFDEFNLFKLISDKVKLSQSYIDGLKRLQYTIFTNSNKLNKDHIWLIYISIIMLSINNECINEIYDRLSLTNLEKNIINNLLKTIDNCKSADNRQKKSEIFSLMAANIDECAIILSFCLDNEKIIDFINSYFLVYKNIKIYINGEDLNSVGISPGKIYKNIFDKVFLAKIDGIKLESKRDELAFVKEIFGL